MMETETVPVVRFPNEVADRITEDSWTTGWGDRKSKTCLLGHIRQCDLRPGDEHIIAAVFPYGRGSMKWNDQQESFVPVAAWARTAEVTDEMLSDKFGPQWRNIVALVRRLASATDDELSRMGRARMGRAGRPVWDAGLEAAWSAAQLASRLAARSAARKAACYRTGYASLEAAHVLVIADLVGEHGFTAEHLDILLEPVREVFGDPLDYETVEAWLEIGGQ